jgi:hypothetical protein
LTFNQQNVKVLNFMLKKLITSVLLGAILFAPTSVDAGWSVYETSFGDPILHWNAIAIQADADDHTGTFGFPEQMGPGRASRALAIVHIAMYDAVNSIDGSSEPYLVKIKVSKKAKVSVDAAVAEAAYTTLVSLYPAKKSVFDAAYDAHMNQIQDKKAKKEGKEIGKIAAKAILSERKKDGWNTEVPYNPSPYPGFHRKDPTNPEQPFLGPTWGKVKPFAIKKGSQFRAAQPPHISSPEYAEAFNEVKAYGGDGVTTPTIRTQDQTNIGLFWAYDGTKKMGTPPRLYNQITRQIAIQKGNTVAQNARLFALVNIAQADAGIGCWESKYFYNYWRPIVGIREADQGTGPTGLGDGNPLTTGDVNWTPLGAPMTNMTMVNFTPPFPAYPSGHATFGAATFRTIELFYGTDYIPFTFTSDELNGVTLDNVGNVRPFAPRSFARLSDATKENAQSRIYLGIHWQFDATEGIKMGNSIADYTFDTVMRPVKEKNYDLWDRSWNLHDSNSNFNNDFNQNFNTNFNTNFNQNFNTNFNTNFNQNFNTNFNTNFNSNFNHNFNNNFFNHSW